MSIHVNPAQIALPEQSYVSLVGRTVVVGRKHDPKRQFYFVQAEIEATAKTSRLLRLEPLDKRGEAKFLSHADIVRLEARSEFRLATMDPGSGLMKGREPQVALLQGDVSNRAFIKVYWLRKFVNFPGFSLSKTAFDAFMLDAQAKEGAPPPVSFITVYREYRKNEQSLWSDPEGVATPKENSGGRSRDPWGPKIAELLKLAIEQVLCLPKPTGADVRSKLAELAAAEGIAESDLPSLRTVQSRIAEVPPVVRDILSKGYEFAARKHGHTEVRALPDRPLEVLEVDEVQLDSEVLDDVTLINLGRPYVVLVVDRLTGIVLAAVIGFSPSFALLSSALKMAFYPKDMTGYEGVDWPQCGPGEALVSDAAKWNRGKDLERMRNDLSMDGHELAPGAPQAKGAVEALAKHINTSVAHNLPGSVMSNVPERQEFEETRLPPLLTLSELRFLVYDWVCNVRNVKPIEGLGPFRTMKAVPAVLWQQHIAKAKSRRPLDVEIFDRLAGYSEQRTIQKDGIRIDHLLYWSDELHYILADKKHKPGKGKHGGSRYTCIRNENDLGYITVVDPYRNKPIRCQVIPLHRPYADGLPIAVHAMFIANYNAQLKAQERNPERPEQQKAKALDVALLARQTRRRLGIEGYFAKFIRDQRNRRIASEIRPATESAAASARMIDVRNPPVVPPTEPRSRVAPPGPPDGTPTQARRRYAGTDKGVREVDRGSAPAPAGTRSRLEIDLKGALDELSNLRSHDKDS